jgi:hypothetical protein
MAMTAPFSGGCACGAIRYECTAGPIASSNCHCRDCQRATGSAFGSFLVVEADAFRLLSGQPKLFRKLSDGGDPMLRGFCQECGSPIVIYEAHRPKLAIVYAATLDDPSRHVPTTDIFTASAQPWDVMNPDLQKFPRMPPLPDSFGR